MNKLAAAWCREWKVTAVLGRGGGLLIMRTYAKRDLVLWAPGSLVAVAIRPSQSVGTVLVFRSLKN
jgi:hypothetical protein